MGNCFGSSSGASDVDPEERRRQMAAAAEKRQQQEDSRGMKDPKGYKKKIEQLEKAEKDASQRNYAGEAPLKVNHSTLLHIVYFSLDVVICDFVWKIPKDLVFHFHYARDIFF